MKCLIISPKAGILRSTQFTSAQIKTISTSARPANPPEQSGDRSGHLSDLDRRCAAPFRLSAALQARLPCSARKELIESNGLVPGRNRPADAVRPGRILG